ncbi:MAG: hypothetical protein IPH68_15785 [Chitinophagaceae bacterium]|nr:hypothetical protein [Chitinophagaceae bacterium]MBK7557600.1 hypothetical protein [Chitinophagaceae bacterium]
MGFLDLLLFPVYVALFYFLFRARRNRYDDPVLKYYHKQAFWIKVIAVVPFTLFNAVLSPGDSFLLYYTESANISHLILKDFSNIKWLYLPSIDFDQSLLKNPLNLGYLRSENNYMIVRITSVLSYLALHKYVILNLFFSMISFSGVWRLYRFFYEQYPHLHKQFAIAILYLPTFVFWSAGILKDPICTGAIGWITYALYEIFYKKKNLVSNVVIILIFGYLLYVIKVYILISYVPFFFLYLVLKNVTLIKSRILRVTLVTGLIVLAITMFTTVMQELAGTLGAYGGEDLAQNISTYQKAYAEQDNAASNFSLGVEFDGSTGSLLRIAPAAIVATLYRPFFWESKKLSTLLSSVESLFIMMFTLFVLYKAGPLNFLRSIMRDPVILYCLLFALLFALFVGATTANFGTLVRYKIPCLPFYIIALYLIHDRTRKIKNSPANDGTV